MKKLLIAAALMTALSANAANWIRIADGDDIRLIMDMDTFTAAKGDDGTPLIGAVFQFVKGGEPGGGFAYLTPVMACRNGAGQLWARNYIEKDNSWQTIGNYFWSADGQRLYDFAGVSLCAVLKAKIEQGTPQKPQQKNSKEKGNI